MPVASEPVACVGEFLQRAPTRLSLSRVGSGHVHRLTGPSLPRRRRASSCEPRTTKAPRCRPSEGILLLGHASGTAMVRGQLRLTRRTAPGSRSRCPVEPARRAAQEQTAGPIAIAAALVRQAMRLRRHVFSAPAAACPRAVHARWRDLRRDDSAPTRRRAGSVPPAKCAAVERCRGRVRGVTTGTGRPC